LVRVGDVNQSITGTFSSSDPKFFKEFMKEADYCYEMNMSNRSSADILELANNLVQFVCSDLSQIECRDALQEIEIKTVEKGQGYKENPEPDKYQINALWYRTFEDEVNKTVKFVKGLKAKYPNKSIGILVPYNSQLSQVSKVLEQEGLEFEELGPNSKNKRKIIDNIAKIIDFILEPDDIEKLITALSDVFIKTDNKEGKSDFLNILRQYTTEEILYSDIKDKPLIIDDKCDMYITFKVGLNYLVEILEHSTTKIDELILFIKERLDLKDEEKSELKEYQIAIDGIAVITNSANKVKDLTLDQVKDIYTGKITNWKEVGGNDADIVVVSREDGSGTRDGFQEIVGFESGDLTSNAQISDGSGNIKTTVQGNENAIGYISFGYLDDSINSVKIGGIEPKEENVYNKKYPISRPFLLVTKGDATGDAKSFIDYVLSDEGQKTIEKEGFMSVNPK